MIEPWQVWIADLDPLEGHEQGGTRPVVVISSEFALRVNVGRMTTVLPVTNTFQRLNYRIPILSPRGGVNYVMTEQARTISTRRLDRNEAWWKLDKDEIAAIHHSLRFLLDL